MRRRNAVLEPVEGGTTKQDDVPVVDCDIKVEGAVIQSVSDQEFSLGPDNWLRGLDAELWKDLLGKKAGESVSKTVKLPDTYQKEEFRGKDAEVAVTIKDIKRPRLPELSDEFAKDMLFGSLDELKTEMRKRLSETKEQAARADLARQVEEKLLASADFKLPEELVKRLAERNVNRARLNLAYQGISRDEIAAATEEIVKGSLIKAVHDVRMEFVFGQLAEKEKVTVSDAEVENRINALAYQRGMRPARFHEELRREGLIEQVRAEIMDEKTMDKLISKAKITTKTTSA
jgi:trigger factor